MKIEKPEKCFLYRCSNRLLVCTEIYSGNILGVEKRMGFEGGVFCFNRINYL